MPHTSPMPTTSFHKSIPWASAARGLQGTTVPQVWSRPFAHIIRLLSDTAQIPTDGIRPPLILGVSGHRNIPTQDFLALHNTIIHVVGSLRDACPDVPIILLSALAEGADRLAAEAVLTLPDTRLIVPLPLPLEEYRQTFANPNDPLFDTLCARSTAVFPIPAPHQELRPLLSGDPDTTPACYEALGIYLSQHCHILLALWDGQGAAGAGGTAQVVHSWLRGTWQSQSPQDTWTTQEETPGRPCIHIQVNREGQSPMYASPGGAFLLYPTGMNCAKALDFVYDTSVRLCAYPAYSPHTANSEPLYNTASDAPVPVDNTDSFAHSLYTAANSYATKYANKLRCQIRQLTWGGFAALLCFQLYRLDLGWGLPVCATLTVTLVYGFFRAKWGDWAKRHLTYRAYAEAMRIQCYWRLCGVPATVTQEMLRPHTQDWAADAHWLAADAACLAIAGDATPSHFTQKEDDLRQKAGHRAWLQGQHSYFKQKAQTNLSAHKRSQYWTTVLLALGGILLLNVRVLSLSKDSLTAGNLDWFQWPSLLVLLTVAALSSFNYLTTKMGLTKTMQKLGVFLGIYALPTLILWLMGLVPLAPDAAKYLTAAYNTLLAGGAAAGGYAHLKAFQANSVRYARYAHLYQHALARLRLADTQATERTILTWLGNRALAENIIWFRQHKERPLQLPSL